jgi:CHAT domain-containing protein/tetratricopeptide (TPR) repeat protein
MQQFILLLILLFSSLYTAEAQPSDPNARAHLAHSLHQVDSLLNAEKYKDAFLLADTLLVQAKTMAGNATLDTLYSRTLHTRGRIMFFNGKYESAIKCHEECLALNRQLYGLESGRCAISLTNLGICWYELKKFEKAIDLHQQALAIYQRLNNPWLPAIADCWNNIANAQAGDGQDEIALKSYDKALRIRYHNEGRYSPGIASIYQNAAGCYIALNQVDEAIKGYEAALEIYNKNPKAKPVSVANAWYNLGLCNQFVGKLEYAQHCIEQSLALRQANLTADHPLILVSLRGLGLTYRKMGDFDRASYYFNGVLEARRRTLKPGDAALTNSLNDAYIAAKQSNDMERAERLSRETIAMEKATGKPDSLRMGRFLSNYGNFLRETDRPDTALVVLQQGFDFYPKNKTSESGIATCYAAIGECYLVMGQLEQADSLIQLALKIQNAPVKKTVSELALSIRQLAQCRIRQGQYAVADSLLGTIFILLELDASDTIHWGNVKAPLELANTLILRAHLHQQWALDGHRAGGHVAALYWGETALSFLSVWETKLAASSSRRDTRALAREAREVCAAAAFKLKTVDPANRETWLQRAFEHIEAAHNTQLHDALLESRGRQVPGKSDPKEERANQLRLQISNSEKQIYLLGQMGINESNDTLMDVQARLFEQKKELDQLQLNNPLLRAAVLPGIRISDLQNTVLRSGQTMLEYLVADSSILIFWANARGHDILELPRDFDLGKSVQQLRQGITAYHTLPLEDPRRSDPVYFDHTISDYITAAVLLYEKLLQPVELNIGKDTDLLIVPDGILHLVPFKALLYARPENSADFGDYPFVALKQHIGTAFSAVLQQEMCLPRPKSDMPAGPALILAPFYTGDPVTLSQKMSVKNNTRSRLDSLPFSGPEAYAVRRALGEGKVLYGGAASLDTFWRYAPNSNVLHFSTHAAADGRFGQYCFIIFAKNGPDHVRLYVRDIYNLHLRADLVTLSTCESALGELQPGEGLIGLTRAFAFAGAKSIVSSLWQVNDASTEELMVSFYINMTRKKMFKDQSLGTATRVYLKDSTLSNELKHPFFWAAFNVLGNQSALK